MAKIRHAEIVGLAGRDDIVSVDFNDDLNVFWGLNGCGKTSLLKILHSGLTGDHSLIVRVPFKSATVAFETADKVLYTRTIRKTFKGKGRPSDAETPQAPIREIDVLQELDSETEHLLVEMSRHMAWSIQPEARGRKDFAHRYLPISRMTDLMRGPDIHAAGFRRDVRGLLNEAQIDEEFARQTLALWQHYNSQAMLLIRRAQEQGLAEVLSAILSGERSGRSSAASAIASDKAYELTLSFFRQQRVKAEPISRQKFTENYERDPLLRNVVARIAEVDHSVRQAQAPQRRLETLLSNLFSNNKEVVLDPRSVSVRIGMEEIPIESLSSGEKQIVRILLECLAARDHCIMIDEPEISLHVDWQHHLVENMRLVNGDVQIILATHSPEVMADIPESKVFEL